MENSFITCRNCGGENPHDARFCIECSESLTSATGPTTKLATPTCTACGAENIPDAKFCSMCGRSLPASVAVGTPWAQPQVAPHPRAQQSVPRRVPVVTPRPPAPVPQAAFPRTMTPPSLPQVPAQPYVQRHHRHRRHHGGAGSAKVVLIAGMIGLIALKLATWPLIMLVLGAAFLVHQAERGRLDHGLKVAAAVGAAMLVANNPRMWPLMIVGFFLIKMFGRSWKW